MWIHSFFSFLFHLCHLTTQTFFFIIRLPFIIWPHRLTVRTRAFPGGVTIAESASKQSSLKGEFCLISATFSSFTVRFEKNFLMIKFKSFLDIYILRGKRRNDMDDFVIGIVTLYLHFFVVLLTFFKISNQEDKNNNYSNN